MAEVLLTWVIPVKAGETNNLRRILAQIDANPGGNARLPFSQLPMVHFASLILFDDGPHAQRPLLVFESNIDSPLREYVKELVRVGRRQGLDAIYRCSSDIAYPDRGAPDDAVVDYLMRRTRRPQLYHIGHPNRSVAAIRGDRELYRAIKAALPGLAVQPPEEIIRTVRGLSNCPGPTRRHLRPENPNGSGNLNDFTWLEDPPSRERLRWILLLVVLALAGAAAFVIVVSGYFDWSRGATTALPAAFVLAAAYPQGSDSSRARLLRSLTLAAIAGGLFAGLTSLQMLTEPEPWLLYFAGVVLAPLLLYLGDHYLRVWVGMSAFTEPFRRSDARRVRALKDADDRDEFTPHNHIAGLAVFHGPWRRLRLVRARLILRFYNLFYRVFFVKGKLANVHTIHFTQWSLVDDGRLLFVTNFHGAWDRYLDDFFRGLGLGIASIWYDTGRGGTALPRTLDPRHLKTWVQRSQTLAGVRYRARVYDGLTVSAINNNTEIRKGLLRRSSPVRARAWLRRFATNPEDPGLHERLFRRLRPRSA